MFRIEGAESTNCHKNPSKLPYSKNSTFEHSLLKKSTNFKKNTFEKKCKHLKIIIGLIRFH